MNPFFERQQIAYSQQCILLDPVEKVLENIVDDVLRADNAANLELVKLPLASGTHSIDGEFHQQLHIAFGTGANSRQYFVEESVWLIAVSVFIVRFPRRFSMGHDRPLKSAQDRNVHATTL